MVHLQQQQRQELEQLQLWHRIQASRQVVTALGRGPGDLAPILTAADLEAAAAMQAPTSQGLYQNCGGEVSSSGIAAVAAGMHGSSGSNAASAARRMAAMAAAPNGGTMQPQADFFQPQMPAGVSLQHGAVNARQDVRQAGIKHGRDAAAAAAAELAVMVNPVDLLSDINFHNMLTDGSSAQLPAQPQGATATAAQYAHAAAAAAAAAAVAGAKVPSMPRPGAQTAGAAAAAVAASGGVHGVGFDAGDIADLWDVLEDYEGGDKESCDALFEHLTDLF
jgi:hypothetical protein